MTAAQAQTPTVQDSIAAIIGFDVSVQLVAKCRFRPQNWADERVMSNRQTVLFISRSTGISDAYVLGAEHQATETVLL